MPTTSHAPTAVLARLGRALADPTRTRLLLLLATGPAYPGELAEALEVSRQTLSNHLARLRGCGLVVAEPEGRRVRYELVDASLGLALQRLVMVTAAVDPHVCPDTDAGCCR